MRNKRKESKWDYEAQIDMKRKRCMGECRRITKHSIIRQGDKEIVTCRECGDSYERTV